MTSSRRLKLAKLSGLFVAVSFAFLIPAGSPVSLIGDAKAQDYRYWNCQDLWYERNSIYANQGYCFKTRRAQNVFGRSCFAPWGRLTGAQQRRVDQIVRWERRKGCR